MTGFVLELGFLFDSFKTPLRLFSDPRMDLEAWRLFGHRCGTVWTSISQSGAFLQRTDHCRLLSRILREAEGVYTLPAVLFRLKAKWSPTSLPQSMAKLGRTTQNPHSRTNGDSASSLASLRQTEA